MALFAACSQVHAQTAMLRVACDGPASNAEVTINGEFKGDCPVDVPVAAGNLRIRVTKKVDSERELVFAQEVRMVGGTVKRIDVEFGSPQLNAEAAQAAAQAKARADAEAAKPAAQAKAKAEARFSEGPSGTLTDSTTGLQWSQSDNGSPVNWKEATSYCQGKGSGWGLPTAAQLEGIFDKTQTTATDCGSFTCRVSRKFRLTEGLFWSNEHNGSSEAAWNVNFRTGTLYAFPVVRRYDSFRALCVRRP